MAETVRESSWWGTLLKILGGLTALIAAIGTLLTVLGLGPVIGPRIATAALGIFGEPCDRVDHPAWRTVIRNVIVDGIQDYEDAEDELFVVEKVSRQDVWAYCQRRLKTDPFPAVKN